MNPKKISNNIVIQVSYSLVVQEYSRVIFLDWVLLGYVWYIIRPTTSLLRMDHGDPSTNGSNC